MRTQVSYVAGMPVGSALARHVPRKALIVPGLALSSASFCMLAVADTREAFLALLLLSHFSAACATAAPPHAGPPADPRADSVAPCTAHHVAASARCVRRRCTSPALGAFTAEVLPPESRGQAGSISRMCADVASFSAPVALGVLADATSCGVSILTTGGLCGGCTALFALRALEVDVLGGAPPGER